MITYSLNEIVSTLKKAARGASLPYGLAEDFSAACSALCIAGLDACSIGLAALNSINLGSSKDLEGEQSFSSIETAQMGSAIFEWAITRADTSAIEIEAVDVPILLVGYGIEAARNYEASFELSAANLPLMHINASGYSSHLAAFVHLSKNQRMTISFTGKSLRNDVPNKISAYSGRSPVDPEVWTALQVFCAKTYVPASEGSRAKGAGAGNSDND